MRRNVVFALAFVVAGQALADGTYHNLSGGAFSQNWSNTGLITADDLWNGVPSVEGYRGDDLTALTGVDPQTILAFAGTPVGGSPTPVIDVTANQTNPDTFFTGGVAEFDTLANPTVALNGSGTADAPFLIFYVNATGASNVNIRYTLRDLDGSTDNSIQQVALQYRIGTTGDFTNLGGGYVADATSGPSSATLVTPVNVTLPGAANNQAQLQIRVITSNAVGNDEWVGVDDIVISASTVPEPATMTALLLGVAALARKRNRR